MKEESINPGRIVRIEIQYAEASLNIVAVHSDATLPLAVRKLYVARAFQPKASTPHTLSIVLGDFSTLVPGDHLLDLSTNLPDYFADDGIGTWIAATFGEHTAIAYYGHSR